MQSSTIDGRRYAHRAFHDVTYAQRAHKEIVGSRPCHVPRVCAQRILSRRQVRIGRHIAIYRAILVLPHHNTAHQCAHGAYQLGIHITARIRRHTSLSLNNMMAHPDCVACKILCQINLGIQFLLWESCYQPCQTTCDSIALSFAADAVLAANKKNRAKKYAPYIANLLVQTFVEFLVYYSTHKRPFST